MSPAVELNQVGTASPQAPGTLPVRTLGARLPSPPHTAPPPLELRATSQLTFTHTHGRLGGSSRHFDK